MTRPAAPAGACLPGRATDFVTATIAGQTFGIPVPAVRDVLAPQRMTRIPLAGPEIAGSLNLRGRIVTVIDLRVCLGLPGHRDAMGAGGGVHVVVDHRGELYSLLVDGVGEVLALLPAVAGASPAALDPRWREAADGIYRLEDRLLVALAVGRLLDRLCTVSG